MFYYSGYLMMKPFEVKGEGRYYSNSLKVGE